MHLVSNGMLNPIWSEMKISIKPECHLLNLKIWYDKSQFNRKCLDQRTQINSHLTKLSRNCQDHVKEINSHLVQFNWKCPDHKREINSHLTQFSWNCPDHRKGRNNHPVLILHQSKMILISNVCLSDFLRHKTVNKEKQYCVRWKDSWELGENLSKLREIFPHRVLMRKRTNNIQYCLVRWRDSWELAKKCSDEDILKYNIARANERRKKKPQPQPRHEHFLRSTIKQNGQD